MRTGLTLPSLTPQSTNSYSLRYADVTKTCNYEQTPLSTLKSQHSTLRSTLETLHLEIGALLQASTHKALAHKGGHKGIETGPEGELLEQQRKNNLMRMEIYQKELNKLEARVKLLQSKNSYMSTINNDLSQTEEKIKEITQMNKQLKKKQDSQGKELVSGDGLLEKLVEEQENLKNIQRKYKKYNQIYTTSTQKIDQYKVKIQEQSQILQKRMQQYKSHEWFLHLLEEEKKKQSLNYAKNRLENHHQVYQKNYLAKLKQLQYLQLQLEKEHLQIKTLDQMNQEMSKEINELCKNSDLKPVRSNSTMHLRPIQLTQSPRRDPPFKIQNKMSEIFGRKSEIAVYRGKL